MRYLVRKTRESRLVWAASAVVAPALVVCAALTLWSLPGQPAQATDPPGLVEETPERLEQASERIARALEVLDRRSDRNQVADTEIRVAAQALLREPDTPALLKNIHNFEGLPVFVHASGPTSAASALVSELSALESHGVDPAFFSLGAWDEAQSVVWGRPRVDEPIKLADEARLRLEARVARLGIMPSPKRLAEAMVSEPASPLYQPALASQMELRRRGLGARAMELAGAEVMLLGMASLYTAKIGAVKTGSAIMEHSEPASRRFGRLLERLSQVKSSEAACRDAIQALTPSRGEYEGLRSALQRYGDVAADGGWARLRWSEDRIEPDEGDVGPDVTALRLRLGQEGFFDGEAEGPYDSYVMAGLRKARERYGLDRWGGLDQELVRRLNVPVEKRLAQLALNLHRWRQVPMSMNQTYLRINVPSGEGELVRNGTRVLQFDVEVSSEARPMSDHVASVRVDPSGAVALLTGDADTLMGTAAGPIRVRQDQALARWLMRLTGQRPEDARGGVLRLNPHVPVHMTYLTTTTDPRGRRLQFHADLHQRDASALNRPTRAGAPSWLRW